MRATFRCGCPRTPENTYEFQRTTATGKKYAQVRCKSCAVARSVKWNRARADGMKRALSATEELILKMLRERPASNESLADQAGMTTKTVTAILRGLRARKLIYISGSSESNGGRPRNIFSAAGVQPIIRDEPAPAADPQQYPDDIRIAQRITYPQYHSSGWSRTR